MRKGAALLDGSQPGRGAVLPLSRCATAPPRGEQWILDAGRIV